MLEGEETGRSSGEIPEETGREEILSEQIMRPEDRNPDLRNSPVLYVGIGASAGGLEAIDAFFSHMPHQSGMAFIVIQHLSPDYKSLMVELLSKRTRMPVRRAEEGMRVKPNQVYLIPPKKNLSIFHGKLLLSEQDQARGFNLPIDVFFHSLAEDQAEKGVGIVLSGTGSDGMRGIRSIKEAGGIVVVQSEESAKFDGMPRSAISTGLADFVLPPGEMPAKLLSIVAHPYVSKVDRGEPALPDEAGLNRILALLREQCKVDFTNYKPNTIARRIERRMTLHQLTDIRDYSRHLESYPQEVRILFQELLIGVTRFFRDPEAFQFLADDWLCDFLSRNSGQDVRFWVPGCSTGEEAYSLAMLCCECLEKINRNVRVKIFATDVDNGALSHASTGVYPAGVAAELSPDCMTKYFHFRENEVQITRSIREMVVFARHNLLKDPPFTNLDLVSCRNLLIYLQPILQNKALGFFNFSLNPGGILFLGSSEITGDLSDCFDLLHPKWKVYRSRGKRHPIGIGNEIVAASAAVPRVASTGRMTPRFHEDEKILDRFLVGVAGEYLPVSVILNERMEIIHIIGDGSRFFRLPSGPMHNDVSRMVIKPLAIPLCTGVLRAFSKREEVRHTNIRLEIGGVATVVQLHIKPLPMEKGMESLVAVIINESGPHLLEFKADLPTYDAGKDVEQRIAELEQELQFSNENLQATIEELETSNEELQATNEELLAGNEELQSTNEELQSVNEELHTVNSEHQLKIMELTEVTNDFDNLLASTEVATIFLDENLLIRRFTPAVAQLFNIIKKDIGRPLGDLSHCITGMDPVAEARRVQQSLARFELEVRTKSGGYYLARVMPYNIDLKAFSGVTLTFINISDLRNVQQDLDASELRYAELFGNMTSGVMVLEPDDSGNDFIVVDINRSGEILSGANLSEVRGMRLLDAFPAMHEKGLIKLLQHASQSGKPVRFPVFRYRNKEQDQWLEYSIYKLPMGQVVVVYDDVTDRIRRKEELLDGNSR